MRKTSFIASGGLGAIAMSMTLIMACSGRGDESWPAGVRVHVHGESLSIGTLQSINGSYGAGCVGRSGFFSVWIDGGATPDHDLLSVIMNNAACELTLTSIVTATDLYEATPPFVLSDQYQPTAPTFQASGGDAFFGNAKLGPLGFGTDFVVSLLVEADPSLTSRTHAAGYAYATQIAVNNALSHWRLDESSPATTATDSRGTNHGTYANGVVLGVAGALAGSSNSAAQFDGVDDYVTVARQISDDFSLEFWFKSTQGLGAGAAWYQGAGLVDAEVAGVTYDFGVSLRADGRVLAGAGNPDRTIISTASGWNDDQWHHVVFTRQRSNGALYLYIDGQAQGSATGGTGALTAPASINFGRLQTGINYYAGSLDEVAIYTTVLSAAQVAAHYDAGN